MFFLSNRSSFFVYSSRKFRILMLYICCEIFENKLIFFKNFSRKFTRRSFLNASVIYYYFYALCRHNTNKNLLLILNFFFIALMLGSKTSFFIMGFTLPFSADTGVFSGYLKDLMNL